jgi:hypothetical protein
MAASYPTSVKSFTSKSAGDKVQPSHVNDLQDEVVAVETDLLENWTTYVPTVGGGLTLGNGTVSGRYTQIGKRVWVEIVCTLGSSSSVGSSAFSFSFPIASQATSCFHLARFEESGGVSCIGVATVLTSTVSIFNVATTATAISIDSPTSTQPFTWGDGDSIRVAFWYEAA